MLVDETERLRMAVERLEAEVERLKGETYCAYCGERFPLDAPDATERIGRHIEACPRHPMRAVEAERDAARAEIERLKSVLRMTSAVQDIAAATIDALSARTWQQERAATVAWLRVPSTGQSVFNAIDLCTAANRIEAGEHWPERENG